MTSTVKLVITKSNNHFLSSQLQDLEMEAVLISFKHWNKLNHHLKIL